MTDQPSLFDTAGEKDYLKLEERCAELEELVEAVTRWNVDTWGIIREMSRVLDYYRERYGETEYEEALMIS